MKKAKKQEELREDVPQDEQAQSGGLTEKRKRAMLVYIAVLLAAAFCLVTLSLLSEYRNLKRTNRENQEFSVSISKRAEILQEENQNIPKAYELLLAAMDADEAKNTKELKETLEELEPLSGYLSEQGTAIYETLREHANMGKEAKSS